MTCLAFLVPSTLAIPYTFRCNL